MSRINYGENIWRLHDHMNLPDGSRRLFFRNACEDFDYAVHSSVFQPSPAPPELGKVTQ